jgi:hypothetical protein
MQFSPAIVRGFVFLNDRSWPVAAYKESCIGELFCALERQLCTVLGHLRAGCWLADHLHPIIPASIILGFLNLIIQYLSGVPGQRVPFRNPGPA